MAEAGKRRWLITGVSSGLGRDLMEAALAHGDSVVGTVRNPALKSELEALAPGRAHILRLDVDNAEATGPAVAEAAALLGGLDVVVNNAGSGIFGPIELCPIDDFRRVMETNLYGLIRVTQAALPHLRESKGMVVNFSSIAGLVGRAGMGVYNASKFAVEGLSESLAEEVAPFGVRVMVVNPDAFKSSFFNGRAEKTRGAQADAYAGTPGGEIGAALDAFVGNEPGDPAKLAALVVKAVHAPNPPHNLLVGGWALEGVSAKIARLEADMAAWREDSLATHYS
jgi:NAD(P)-dependent dehydrogenase (short-subunit alcohol dehydrogenase family)